MSEYPTGLNAQSTVGSVFRHLHQRGLALVDELSTRQTLQVGEGKRQTVVGSPLETSWWIEGRDNRAGERLYTRGIGVRHEGALFQLLAVSVIEFHNRQSFPLGISAYRDSELGGHYALTQDETGIIQARLGRLPFAIGSTSSEEFIGCSTFEQPLQRIRSLPAEDRARVHTVVPHIVQSLAAVELIKDGASLLDIMTLTSETGIPVPV